MSGRRGTVGMAITILALACAAAAAMAAGGGVWVSSDGETHGIHEGGKVMLVGGDEGFDLSQLADGETRVFGSGDRAVTASRQGDVATITRAASGDREALNVSCDLGRDTCRIVTAENEPERVMIVVQKERTCTNGEGDCAQEVSVDALPGDGHQVMIRKVVHCDDEGGCEEAEDVAQGMLHIEDVGSELPGHHLMFMRSIEDAAGATEIVVMPRGDSVMLRCPEGDATLRVKKEEAEEVYLCPKHSQPLRRVEPRTLQMKQRQEQAEPRSH